MKKNLITILLPLLLILTACGASSNSTQTSSTGSFGSGPLPLAMSMAIGTFKLEGTENAVSADQAAQLITLWQVYKDLSSSSSAAQEEIDGLASQIQGVMTPKQLQAITDMKLTRKDIFQTMQELGITTGRPNASGTPRPGGQGGGNFFGGGNGGPPGGGQGGFNTGNLSPQQIATFQARRAQNGGSGQFNRIPPALFDALIKLLQSKK